MAKGKELEVVEQPKTGEIIPSEYRALAVPVQQLTKFIKENLGNQGLKPFDLDRVRIPSGGQQSWEVPTLKGPKPFEVLEGIVVAFKDVRSYWKEKYGEGDGNQPPDCASENGLIGIGDPGGDCLKCPFAAFGSATDQAGKPAKGQACRQLRMMLFLRQEDMIPLLVTIPPTSLGEARKYFLRLVQNGYPYYGVTTQLRLTKASSGKIAYSKASFAMGRDLKPEEFEKVQVIGKSLKAVFEKAEVVEADVRGTESAQ